MSWKVGSERKEIFLDIVLRVLTYYERSQVLNINDLNRRSMKEKEHLPRPSFKNLFSTQEKVGLICEQLENK